MRSVGDVFNARMDFASRRSANLYVLLRDRYSWMQQFVDQNANGAELGCGAGWSKEFLDARALYLTDYASYNFLDVHYVDAMALPFRSESLDFLIAANVIHHLPFPFRFFDECHRVLRPNGVLLIAEPHASDLMCLLLRIMAHEGYDFSVDPFDRSSPVVESGDLWLGNNAVARLLFEDRTRFLDEFRGWTFEHDEICECLTFINSGGVTAKTLFFPLPLPLAELTARLDRAITFLLPNTMGLLRKVALRRT